MPWPGGSFTSGWRGGAYLFFPRQSRRLARNLSLHRFNTHHCQFQVSWSAVGLAHRPLPPPPLGWGGGGFQKATRRKQPALLSILLLPFQTPPIPFKTHSCSSVFKEIVSSVRTSSMYSCQCHWLSGWVIVSDFGDKYSTYRACELTMHYYIFLFSLAAFRSAHFKINCCNIINATHTAHVNSRNKQMQQVSCLIVTVYPRL